MLANTTDTAEATVTMGQLSMSGDTMTSDNGNVQNVSATVSGSWSYELPGGSPDHSTVALMVSDGESWYSVAEQTDSREYNQYSGEYEISGSVTDTEAFDPSFFAAPGPGQQTIVDLPFRVWFQVLNSNDQPLADARIEDTATVTVGQNSINATEYGQVSGEGSVNIQ